MVLLLFLLFQLALQPLDFPANTSADSRLLQCADPGVATPLSHLLTTWDIIPKFLGHGFLGDAPAKLRHLEKNSMTVKARESTVKLKCQRTVSMASRIFLTR